VYAVRSRRGVGRPVRRPTLRLGFLTAGSPGRNPFRVPGQPVPPPGGRTRFQPGRGGGGGPAPGRRGRFSSTGAGRVPDAAPPEAAEGPRPFGLVSSPPGDAGRRARGNGLSLKAVASFEAVPPPRWQENGTAFAVRWRTKS